MKAFVIEQAGTPDALKLRDIAPVQPSSDEVRIRVRALGLNRAETYLRAGKMGPITAPRVPGIEAVGEVIHDPSGTFRTGQRVATAMGGMQFARHGSYAEEVTVLRSNVISLDGSTLSWEELAALPEAYLTVWGALDKSLAIQPGQTLLVRGATSSVGMAALTYAKARGLKVIATTRSADNVQRLREMGADHVLIDNGSIAEQVRQLIAQGVDAVLEVVGAATVRDSLKAVRPFGAVSVIGLLGGAPVLEQLNLMQDLPAAVKLNFFGSGLLGTQDMPLKDSPLLWIAKEIEAGRMPSIRTKTFDFEQIPDAHRLIESNGALGKLVVKL
ncbi:MULTISPECIES: zinc-binding alcohol dehydrogenase family protein [Pseudomonas]|uniref:Zinc-binding dehydrogenase n=1 Tax=Pseudomonas gessardii TaxID=78544 RepID=A0A7Y1MUV7_9PSED|nr:MULTISPECIES: zinc-binding alcohol dehydrogenase family protein [Pseudomonas]MBH3426036.1 zinc-binding dehydrogenase [Pseudomonas gessardii]NNA67408.1 zinc-binding dehydrogenase [Pseudomonas gessardii]NNA98710.1 zinc-binding dehydrogenase [Pseudomonas gessardii]PHN61471.1 alcohol dehydrogenase [Pseudomonas sp. ICMP 8385]